MLRLLNDRSNEIASGANKNSVGSSVRAYAMALGLVLSGNNGFLGNEAKASSSNVGDSYSSYSVNEKNPELNMESLIKTKIEEKGFKYDERFRMAILKISKINGVDIENEKNLGKVSNYIDGFYEILSNTGLNNDELNLLIKIIIEFKLFQENIISGVIFKVSEFYGEIGFTNKMIELNQIYHKKGSINETDLEIIFKEYIDNQKNKIIIITLLCLVFVIGMPTIVGKFVDSSFNDY